MIIQPQAGTAGASGIDEQQLGYELLLRLRNTQERVRELKAIKARSKAQDDELTQLRKTSSATNPSSTT